MSAAIEQMLNSYRADSIYDRKNAMKEIMQEIVLCGLSRAGFFKKAAFYGGTALRIFLIDSGDLSAEADCSVTEIKRMLSERFDSIDYAQARQDVEPFVHDSSVMDVWNPEFFKQITEKLTAQ